MDKKIAIGAGAGAALLVVALAFPLSNMSARTLDAALAAKVTHPALQAELDFYATSCVDCHSATAQLPFYASFPIAKDKINQHRLHAVKYWNADRELFVGGLPSEAALAKIQQVLEDGSMPPGDYTALHWNASVSPEEKQAQLAMIRTLRAEASPGYDDPNDPLLARAVLPIVDTSGSLPPDKIELGRKLYHDTRLSKDNTLSCASCHGLDMGGSDEAVSSTGVDDQKGPINSPTTFNAVYAVAQFWDGRAEDLQAQAAGPVENPIEMADDWDDVVVELAQDPEFVAEFMAVYGPEGWSLDQLPEPGEDGLLPAPAELTAEALTDAIAVFEMTLVTPNSPFDRWLKGEQDAMSAEAIAGWEIFDARGCDTCHAGQALGQTSFEKMGLTADYFADRGGITEVDKGRMGVTEDPADQHHFKVPTLRNIALSWPYFHDGQTRDLAGAVRTMAKYQREHELSEEEIPKVVAFLESLTGEYQGEPL
jgi:cytochrome c peroxidase